MSAMRTWAMAAAMAVTLAGCGESVPDLGASYPVKGRVTLPDGKPLAQVKVVFTGPATNNGITGADGAFTLEGEGLPAGTYKVRLEGGPSTGSKKRGNLPYASKYLDEDSTDLEATVKADGSNDFDFRLTREDGAPKGVGSPPASASDPQPW